jgi:hypothetical protein
MPPTPVPKKTRCRLSNAQRKQMCEYSKKNPFARHQDIADEFMQRYPGLKLDRSTISKVLKKKEQYLLLEENSTTQNRYKNRRAKYPELEMAMNLWVSQVSAAGLILTDELVKLKGRDFGQHLGIPDDNVKFSNGWITNFKKWNSLRRYQLHGEASSAPLDSLPGERIKLQELLSQYQPEDIYNADETGLFYRMLPHQTLAKQAVAGKKKVRNFNIFVYFRLEI